MTAPGGDAATADVPVITADVPVITADVPRAAEDVRANPVDAPDGRDAGHVDAGSAPVDAGSAPVDAGGATAIYETILRPRCGSCHGEDHRGSALVMTDPATAYRALVNVPVQSRWIEVCTTQWSPPLASSYRVRPGDPGVSMLDWLPRCYVRDADHMRLTDPERATIRGWILAGAPESSL